LLILKLICFCDVSLFLTEWVSSAVRLLTVYRGARFELWQRYRRSWLRFIVIFSSVPPEELLENISMRRQPLSFRFFQICHSSIIPPCDTI
jgi:hypothetical protein